MYGQLLRIARFLAVGVIGLAVDNGVYSLAFMELNSAPLSRALSLGCATVVTWSLNRRFTFRASGRSASEESLRYGFVAFVAQGVNYTTFLLVTDMLPTLSHHVAILFSAIIATFFSFSGHFIFSFAPTKVGASLSRDADSDARA
jgi:putative flippase GtrA